MSWRPNWWCNPYNTGDTSSNFTQAECFEAGADAMLEVVEKQLGCSIEDLIRIKLYTQMGGIMAEAMRDKRAREGKDE